MSQNVGSVKVGTLRGPNALLLIIGVVVALIALLVALVSGRTAPAASTAPVVVLTTNVPANTALIRSDLKLSHVPVSAVPPQAITSVASAVKKFAAVNLNTGEVLSGNLLLSSTQEATTGPVLNIPPGTVAITVPTGGELGGVAGYPQPGDQLDLIVSTPKGYTKVTFSSLTILRVNGPASGAGANPGNQTSFTVAVPLAEAEQITWAFNNLTWKWVLRSPYNYKTPEVKVQGVNQGTFYAKYGLQ